MSKPSQSGTPHNQRVYVKANGQLHWGWTGVSIQRGLDNAVTTADLAVPFDRMGRLSFAEGDAVEVLIGDDRVLTGYVCATTETSGPDTAGATVVIRSRTCDLVDCSAVNAPGQWKGATVLEIAREIAAPFGIEVVGPQTEPLGSFELEQGEGAFAAIERAARFAALLVRDDAAGRLVLFRPGDNRADGAIRHKTLTGEGAGSNNVLEIERQFDATGRFSEMIVRGQSGGDDQSFGAASLAGSGRVTDPNVSRFRPKVLQAENGGTGADFDRRARWEMARAIGNSLEVSVRLPGWRQTPDGALWDVDLLTLVESDRPSINRLMLISSVAWSIDPDAGRITDLTLQPPEAWEPEPPKKQAVAAGSASGVDTMGFEAQLQKARGQQ